MSRLRRDGLPFEVTRASTRSSSSRASDVSNSEVTGAATTRSSSSRACDVSNSEVSTATTTRSTTRSSSSRASHVSNTAPRTDARREATRNARLRRASILAERRSRTAPRTDARREATRNARLRRASILAERRSRRHPTNPQNNEMSLELSLVHEHYSNLRNQRSENGNDPFAPTPFGISPFNSLRDIPETHVFKQTDLYHEDNIECEFCGACLFKEEKTNCCMNGKYSVHPLHEIPAELRTIFLSREFQRNQRKYNNLLAFTAMAAGGMKKQTWTNPPVNSMLTMHGRCYFRAFDCNETYADMNVRNSSRMYIYDGYFNSQASSLQVDPRTATALRSYVRDNIPWAQQYRSAVDEVLASPSVASAPAFIEFAQVSRVNDGPVIGQPVASNEIAALLYSHGDKCSSKQPIITYPKNSPDDKPRFLPQWSSAIEPLQFPLLFCHGETGWSKGHYSEEPSFKSKTMNRSNSEHVPFLFYCRQRLLCEPVFKYNSRISQEWACSMFCRFEEETLSYAETSHMQKRVASFRSVRESGSEKPGKLLPATFHGSPFKKKKDTEDALATVNRLGRPHVMITMTCNPDWPEIKDNLLPGQAAVDNPTLCCQVFKVKVGVLMDELKSGKVFGPLVWYTGSIEFQKRGFPHLHVICCFKRPIPKTPDEMDEWVWAQLPDEKLNDGRLREYVLKYNVHRPCGARNPDAPCMETNRETNRKFCSKHYPQPWRTTAAVNDRTGRVEYKRIDNGDRPKIRQRIKNVWEDVEIDNRYIVPYNAHLLLLLGCHVCTDLVTAEAVVVYIFKYVNKKLDFTLCRISGVDSEIEQYRRTRYVSSAEANWRILGYNMSLRSPAVTLVHAHLEGEQNVVYPDEATAEERQEIADAAVSDLMRYFNRPAPTAFSQLTMLEYYEQYIVKKKRKNDPVPTAAPPGKWLDGYGNVVSERTTTHVCRIQFKSPAVGDLFYLRLMLHKTYARSFTQLRTVRSAQGIETVHDTFQSAARALGLVAGDEEYFMCMEEASVYKAGKQLRGLFVTLILDGGPAPKLWEQYQHLLIEDILRRLEEPDAVDEALRQIDYKLQLHGKSNEQLGLPPAKHLRTEYERMKYAFNRGTQKDFADKHETMLTSEQRPIYTAIVDAVRNKKPKVVFCDAPAGTGKTFCEKVIAARLRSEGFVVVAVASTGIAALNLEGGWTAHSMFKLPMDENVAPGAVCSIKRESQRAELLRKCDLIIFDELPMVHKYCIEAIDITLRDLMHTNVIFGGKTFLMSGDWRQTSPIVPFATPADIVDAAFISSKLWDSVTRMRLTISQRDKTDAAYSSFVRQVGEGKIPLQEFPTGEQLMPLSHSSETNESFTLKYTTDFDKLLDFVYPDFSDDTNSMHDHAILATHNSSIDDANAEILKRRPGVRAEFLSSDSIITDEDGPDASPFASPEHLNNINVPGVPPHKLQLQDNALAMIIRNLNFSEGLVNGQKVIIRSISPGSRVVQVEIPGENNQIILIPRINFKPKVGRNGITFSRVQFPLRIAYSLTISKSQGQTLSRIGLDLRSHPFGHGMLYVALSRAQSRSSVLCLVSPGHVINNVAHVANVVYPEFIHAATQVIDSSASDQPAQTHSSHLSITVGRGSTNHSSTASAGKQSSSAGIPDNSNSSSRQGNNNGSNESGNNGLPVYQWTLINEIGDGACLLRCISRYFNGTPNYHQVVRNMLLQYISTHLDHIFPNTNVTFRQTIQNGIMNNESITIMGQYPVAYNSVPHYLQLMSHPHAYATFLEIAAAERMFGITICIIYPANNQHPPAIPQPNTCYVSYTSEHYRSYVWNLIQQ